MTTAPDDLLALRHSIGLLTGITDSSALGIVGDDRHGSGYHLGTQTLKNRGVYPDYSTRLPQDKVGGDLASGMDVTLSWPRGGRAAAIKWSNNVATAVRNGQLPYVAEINWLNLAGNKRRLTTYNMQEVATSDTVDIHTHLGFYRNTEGTRDFRLLLSMMDNAITGGTDVAFSSQEERDIVYTLVSNPSGPIHARMTVLMGMVSQLLGNTIDYNAIGKAVADVLVSDETLPHITDADRDSIAQRTAALFGARLAKEGN